MPKLQQIMHRFVERVPSPLEDGVIYVSISFGTVIHKCCCGCGDKVVTPLTPVDWAVTYDGQSISLFPSIGRWDAPCRSHYWIQNNRVLWSDQWSKDQIDALRNRETALRSHYFGVNQEHLPEQAGSVKPEQDLGRRGWLAWIEELFGRWRNRFRTV